MPASALIGGAEGRGMQTALGGLELGRINIAARGCGIAKAALDESVRYAQLRKTFGKPIAEHQAIALKLAEMAMRTESAIALTYNAARAYDAGQRCDMEAGMAKYTASEAALANATDAMRIHGAYGYSKEFNIERYYRDAPLLCIGEGTNEMQKIIIAASWSSGTGCEAWRRDRERAFPAPVQPLQVGRRTLRNRIALPATLTNYARRPSRHRSLDRFPRRARQGRRRHARSPRSSRSIPRRSPTARSSPATSRETRTASAAPPRRSKARAPAWSRSSGIPAASSCGIRCAPPMGISDQPDAYSWTVPHVMSTDELRARRRRICGDRRAAVALRLRRRRAAWRARLPDHPDPLAVVEPARRPLRRLAGEPHPFRARGRGGDPRRPAERTSSSA